MFKKEDKVLISKDALLRRYMRNHNCTYERAEIDHSIFIKDVLNVTEYFIIKEITRDCITITVRAVAKKGKKVYNGLLYVPIDVITPLIPDRFTDMLYYV